VFSAAVVVAFPRPAVACSSSRKLLKTLARRPDYSAVLDHGVEDVAGFWRLIERKAERR
jgi:hypothetical protein